jgi:hemophore-related protein
VHRLAIGSVTELVCRRRSGQISGGGSDRRVTSTCETVWPNGGLFAVGPEQRAFSTSTTNDCRPATVTPTVAKVLKMRADASLAVSGFQISAQRCDRRHECCLGVDSHQGLRCAAGASESGVALEFLFATISSSVVVSYALSTAGQTPDEGSQRMFQSGRTMRSALVGVIGTGAMAGAMLFGGAAAAFADPTPAPPAPPAPGCTAADLAQASGTVGTGMAGYMFSHPDVNNFFTGLRGLPNQEIRGDVQNYMNANPQVESDINGIRQPLTDLRNRCDYQPILGQ